MEQQKPKIRVEDLIVIFGKSPHEKALPMLRDGFSKEEILEQTDHIVGVADVSFSVNQGETFVVMGLSGSGKSTLIRCINRMIDPTTGQVYIDDENVLEADKKHLRELRRTRMAMVFQHFNLLPHRTIAENVGFGLKVRGIDEDERHQKAMDALDMVGLKAWADWYPSNLSGGMQQRVGLARALATDADILLMDEAFGALDPLIRREMQDELMQLQEQLHKTILFITHDLNEALRIGDRVAIMKDGKIVQTGNPVEIITHPANDYVAAFMQDVDQSRVLTAGVVMSQPETLVLGRDDILQTALKRLEEDEDLETFYVLNGNQHLKGMLYRQDVLRAAKHGDNNIERYIKRDFPKTEKSSPIVELYAPTAEGKSIAVVDEHGRLHGVLDARDVLSNLAKVEEIGAEAEHTN